MNSHRAFLCFHCSVFVSSSERAAAQQSAAEQLFGAHAASLHRYLTRLDGDADVAADAVQETFVRYLARQPTGSPPRAWLFRVGTNLIREWSRTRRNRTRLLEAVPALTLVGDAPSRPDTIAEDRELARRVRTALDELPDRDRTLLLMREDGFSHREMAQTVGTTTKSVGTLIARALVRLGRELSLHEEAES